MNDNTSRKSTSGAREGGFFTAYLGQGAFWITEDYHLYHREGESQKDKEFTNRFRREFMESKDTVRVDIGNNVYFINCSFDPPLGKEPIEVWAQRIAKSLYDKSNEKVRLDDDEI